MKGTSSIPSQICSHLKIKGARYGVLANCNGPIEILSVVWKLTVKSNKAEMMGVIGTYRSSVIPWASTELLFLTGWDIKGFIAQFVIIQVKEMKFMELWVFLEVGLNLVYRKPVIYDLPHVKPIECFMLLTVPGEFFDY